jgi:hypothetical protein
MFTGEKQVMAEGIYVLRDATGAYYRLWFGVVPAADWEGLEHELACFPSHAEAEAVAYWLRCHELGGWRAVPHPRASAPPEPAPAESPASTTPRRPRKPRAAPLASK